MFPCDWMTYVVKVIDIVYYHWTPRSCKYATYSSSCFWLTTRNWMQHYPSANTMYLHNAHSSITRTSWDTESFLPCFWGKDKKIPVRPCAACQNHCSSKVICSKVHYHHHLWWWIPYDGGRPAAASTHNDILLLLAVTPRQMAHSQQPACQTEHTHNTEFGPHRQKQGGSRNGKADFICGKAPVFNVVSKLFRSNQRWHSEINVFCCVLTFF